MELQELFAVIEEQRKNVSHDLYIIAGQLQESNVAPIDSWTFFLWLQDNHIPSVYVLKEKDDFYREKVKDGGYKDVIVLKSDNIKLELISHVDIWCRACAFVVEWDLGGNEVDFWIRDLTDCRYVFLQHGVTSLYVTDIQLYPCHNIYNDINVFSDKERELIEQGKKKGLCFVAGLPRYDLIEDLSKDNEPNIVLVMFTWRHKFSEQIECLYNSAYWHGLMALFQDENQKILESNNIRLLVAFHHSLIRNTDIKIPSNIKFISQKDISYWVRHANALVTDLSSLAFDFLFQKKPVVFWIPDKNDAIYEKNGIDYKKIEAARKKHIDFFNVADTVQDVVAKLTAYNETGFTLESQYSQIVDSWFDNRTAISRQVFEQIEHRLALGRFLSLNQHRSQNANPKVSVIIPLYNAEAYIEKCINSIICQPFSDFEIIIVNDGSKDNSLQLIESYASKDSRIHVFSQANGGVSSARNLGMKKAKGEYVTFIDIDDYVDDDFFFPLISNATEDIIFTQYKCFDEHGNIRNGENVGILCSTKDIYEIRKYLAVWLHQNIMRTPWGKFIRRELLYDKEFPLKQTIGEDSVFMFSILSEIKSIKTVDYAHYMWRDHAEGFEKKYQLPVNTAIIFLLNIYKSYKTIGVSSPHLEATLYFTFFLLSQKSIGRFRWRWFARPIIRELWESIDFEYKNIHKRKFQKYARFSLIYRIIDKNRFSLL